MMGIKISKECLLLLVIVIFCGIIPSTPKLSDKRLCYDDECSVAIAQAKTVSTYHSRDKDILSFPINADVTVFSKEAGSRTDLWGVEILGKRGYVPKSFIREKKVLHKHELLHEVPTENISKENISKDHKIKEEKVHSGFIDSSIESRGSSPITPQVSPSFEIVDGTTLHFSSDNDRAEESYATRIKSNPGSREEGPVLSVHPHVVSSEVDVREDLTSETGDLSLGVDDEGQKTENDELNKNEGILEKIVENTTEKIGNNEISSEENIAEDIQNNTGTFSEEITDSKPQEVPVESEEQIEEEKLTVELNKQEESTEEPEEETQNYLSSAFQTVTSMFDSLSTTESPAVDTIDEEGSNEAVKTGDEIPEAVTIAERDPVTEETIPDDSGIETKIPEVTLEESGIPNDEEIDSEPIIEGNSTISSGIQQSEYAGRVNEGVGSINTTSTSNPVELDNQSIPNNETDDNPVLEDKGQPGIYRNDELSGPSQSIDVNKLLNFNGFPNRNLLNVESGQQEKENVEKIEKLASVEYVEPTQESVPEEKPLVAPPEPSAAPEVVKTEEIPEQTTEIPQEHLQDAQLPVSDVPKALEQPLEVCEADNNCPDPSPQEKEDETPFYDTAMGSAINFGRNYWEALSYVALTAFTTLLFSLGYYYIENRRRDGELIAKINKLEKELLVSTKECSALDEIVKSTKNKLSSIEDESFGSNEMVLSLKIELDNAHRTKSELEDQVSALEKDLEGATEAGLELERMLREILATNSAENPLAKSVEDLQARLNAQQAANESLTSALHLKTQEGEILSRDFALAIQKCEQLEVEVTRITEELRGEREFRGKVEGTLSKKVEELEKKLKDISAERMNLRKQLKGKEMELKDLLEVIKQSKTQKIDFDKLADISHIKAEAIQLTEERDELKMKLSEVEGAHQLLEEHMIVIKEEVVLLSEQCKLAEKEKREAETRLEVLSNFFKEKEAERQKEEASWLQQQGEVSSTVERLQTMHNEIMNYKQQIESLKREILDQEREYKSQITSLEAKAHEQWVLARQNERRLEESKSEAAQLRNRLTMIEKNINDTESDVKLHRMESNGDPATSPLFLGAEASSSPIMFSGASGPPPPPPSYLYGPPLPPYMPPPLPPPGLPPYDVSQRPPPLGGRLASPPPLHPSSSGRYDGPGSLSPPPHSPPLMPPYRNFPPPFGNERIPPPLPPSWGDEPPSRNTGFHPFHRDHQRIREKGSLHSSGESLDKSHHSGKV